MKCGECRYWAEIDPEDGVRVGTCKHTMVIRWFTDEEKMREDGVLTCDEGGMTDELMTGPAFGCIHWEAKP